MKTTDEQGRQIMAVQRDDESGDVLRSIPAPKRAKKKAKKKGKRKIVRKVRRTDDRMQLQIRVGEKLIENLDAAVTWVNYLDVVTDTLVEVGAEETRTSLGCRAIARRLDGTVDGQPWEPGRTTADVLVGNRKPLLIRVEREMMAAIDEAYTAAGTTRTVWVLDALLAELAHVRAQVAATPQPAADAA